MSKNITRYSVKYTHFGEVIQGVFSSISPNKCALSLPICIDSKKNNSFIKKNYFKDSFLFSNASCYSEHINSKILSLKPLNFYKSKLLLKKILELNSKKKISGKINIYSSIPECRGLGSSTATLISLIGLLKKKFKIRISNEDALKKCASIEPTDPILIKKNCLFSTKEGIKKSQLNFRFPKFIIYGFDTDPKGKGINTVKMKDIKYSKSEINFFKKSYDKLKKMKTYDKKIFKDMARKSLIINQKYFPKNKFKIILDLELKLSNEFIVGAHSGTVIGFVYKYDKSNGVHFNDNKDNEILKVISKVFKSKITKYLHV